MTIPRSDMRGAVQLDHVSFAYAGQSLRTIDDVTLTIPAGSHVAIVGPTGSGKTTLGYLLARLYDVDAGAIRFDGVDLRDLGFATLSQMLGVVSQEPYLLNASVAENLRFVCPKATGADMIAAAKVAQIHDHIAALPEGYDTLVGEGGFRFSGGEKQRLALARTILRDPPILLLDEATSALDTRTERAMPQALEPCIDLVGQFVGLGIFGFEVVELVAQRLTPGALVFGQIDRRPGDRPKALGVAIGEVGRDLDPLPAFAGDGLRFGLQLVGDELLQQRDILDPAPVVVLEQIAQDDAAGLLIDLDGDEADAAIRGADGVLRQHPADLIGLLRPAMLDRLPDLLLARVVGGDGEGHELIEGHLVLGIGIEQSLRDGDELEPLLDDGGRDEEARGDLLLGETLIAQRPESPELVEGVKRRAMGILGERVFFSRDFGPGFADHAGHRRGLVEALGLHEKFERPVAATASGDLEHAGLRAIGIENRSNVEALQETAAGDVLGQLFDRDAGLRGGRTPGLDPWHPTGF
ncbi:ABC transporter family protein [Rhodovulum visakhapatnamense]|uniref:ABC transporter family protein n=1 Tax=Rhodovulum visakhapatnamense TaxID=364297 RepID=A0A4R8F7P7_9RHOB|nr:ABC transporter family protein [Rhodovulum visakhapatnamense]